MSGTSISGSTTPQACAQEAGQMINWLDAGQKGQKPDQTLHRTGQCRSGLVVGVNANSHFKAAATGAAATAPLTGPAAAPQECRITFGTQNAAITSGRCGL